MVEGDGSFAADVAEALDGDGGVGDGYLHVFEIFFDEVGDAGAGGFAAALRAAAQPPEAVIRRQPG